MSNYKRIALAAVAVALTAAASIMPEYAEAANGLKRVYAARANGL